MARRSGLGKGLGALIPSEDETAASADDNADTVVAATMPVAPPTPSAPAPQPRASDEVLREVPIESISANRYQPREHFDDESLAALAASIGSLGVLQPILVRPVDDGFELVAGERRWRAAQLAGLEAIPVLVRATEDLASLEQALVENLHREDLSPLEEAAAYQQLIDEFSLTQEAVASQVGKSRSAVTNALRLLHLPPKAQALLATGQLSAGHGRALLAISDTGHLEATARKCAAEEWSVRELERHVRELGAASKPKPKKKATAERPAGLLEIETQLADRLDTRVHVSVGEKRGRLTIDFADMTDLDRIYRVMLGRSPVTDVTDT